MLAKIKSSDSKTSNITSYWCLMNADGEMQELPEKLKELVKPSIDW